MQCPRCKGSGIVEKYKHVHGGRRYRCNGTGMIGDVPQSKRDESQPETAIGREYRLIGSDLKLKRGSRDWYLWKAAQETDADWRRRWLDEAALLQQLSTIERQAEEGLIPFWPEAITIREDIDS